MEAKRELPTAARERSARATGRLMVVGLIGVAGVAGVGSAGCVTAEPDSGESVPDAREAAADAAGRLRGRLESGTLSMTVAGHGAMARVDVPVVDGFVAVGTPIESLEIELAAIDLTGVFGDGVGRPRALVDVSLALVAPVAEEPATVDLALRWSLAIDRHVYPLSEQRLGGVTLSLEVEEERRAIVRGALPGLAWSWGGVVEVSDLSLLAEGELLIGGSGD